MKQGDEVLKQIKLAHDVAFDTVLKTFLMACTADSADIQTMAVFNDLSNGKPAKAIDYNRKRLVIQKVE